jgi:membrane-associated phospholipid phosphatase
MLGCVLISAGGCLLVAVVLGLLRRQPMSADIELRAELLGLLGGQHDLLQLLVLPSEPVVLLPTAALITAAVGLQRRWDDVGLAVAGPLLAVAVNSWVLKPLFGWLSDDRLAYPSGHTASLVAVCVGLVLLARDGPATWVAVTVGVLLTAAAGLGMVVLGFHHPGDIVGGVFVGVGVVLACAVAARTVAGSGRRDAGAA